VQNGGSYAEDQKYTRAAIFPAGAIGECSMDQNHVLDAGWRRRSCGPLQQQNRAHQRSSERYKSVLFMALSSPVLGSMNYQG